MPLRQSPLGPPNPPLSTSSLLGQHVVCPLSLGRGVCGFACHVLRDLERWQFKYFSQLNILVSPTVKTQIMRRAHSLIGWVARNPEAWRNLNNFGIIYRERGIVKRIHTCIVLSNMRWQRFHPILNLPRHTKIGSAKRRVKESKGCLKFKQ